METLSAAIKRHRQELDRLSQRLNFFIGRHAPMRPDLVVVKRLQRLIASYYGQPISVMTRRGRGERLSVCVWPRNVAIYFARTKTTLTLGELGQLFGNREHGTIVNAVRNVQNRAMTEARFRVEIDALEKLIHQNVR